MPSVVTEPRRIPFPRRGGSGAALATAPPGGGAGAPSFRPDIEGLRAVAVLLVVVFHAGVSAISGGFVGVDVFFVISGFLITSLLLRERERTGRISLAGFYARRARRILPAATLVLLATVIAAYELLGPVAGVGAGRDGVWAAVFASNIHAARVGTGYFTSQAPPSPLQHFWSLAVEEQFYLVWPAMLIGLGAVCRRRFRAAAAVLLTLGAAASFAWCVVETASNATWAYYSPLSRAWELGVGAGLAMAAPLLARIPRTAAVALAWLGLAGIVVAAVSFSSTTAFPGVAAALPVFGAAAVIAGGAARQAGHPSRVGAFAAARLLGTRPFRLVGRWSYSWYLWHWPALVIAADYAGHELSLPVRLGIAAATLPVAALTHLLIESPARHAPRLAARTRNTCYFAIILIVGAAAVSNVVVTIAGEGAYRFPAPPSAAEQAKLPGATARQVEAAVSAGASMSWLPSRLSGSLVGVNADRGPALRDGCEADYPVTDVPPLGKCEYGDLASKRTIVIFGDSHAAMWVPALEVAAVRTHWKLIVLSKAACPVARFTEWSWQLRRPNRECDAYRAAAIKRIRALHPQLTVITSNASDIDYAYDGRPRSTGFDDVWRAGLAVTLDQLRPATDRLVVLGDIPAQLKAAPDCLSAHPRAVGACNAPAASAVGVAHNAMEAHVAAAHGAGYVNVIPWLCTPKVCPVVIHDTVVYFDRWHITGTYSDWLSGPLATALRLGGRAPAARS